MGRTAAQGDERAAGSRLLLGLGAAAVVIVVGTLWFQLVQRMLWTYATRCGEEVDVGGRFALSLAALFARGAFLAATALLLWILVRAARRHPRRLLSALVVVLLIALVLSWVYLAVLVRVIDPALLDELRTHCRGGYLTEGPAAE